MRARAREINIFNMSLLDILCGALGAFCFMMLVLLPYYKPPASATDLRRQETQTQELLRELEKLRQQAKDSGMAQQMAEVIQRLQEQIKQLQGQVNQFAAQNEQLKSENRSLVAKNQKQAAQLIMRSPFFTMVVASPPQDVGMYLWSDGFTEDKKSNPPLDLAKLHQPTFFSGDQAAWWPDHGAAVWMTRDTPAGVHYKLYVKIQPATDPWSASSAPTTIQGIATSDSWKIQLPEVTLNSARPWTLVGTFSVTPEEKMTFKEANQAERDAEWSKLSKGTPPPQPSAASPSKMPFSEAQPTASIPAERRALIDQITKARQQKQQGQAASPSASVPGGSP